MDQQRERPEFVSGGVVPGSPDSDLVLAVLDRVCYPLSPERLRQLGLNVDADRLEAGRFPGSGQEPS